MEIFYGKSYQDPYFYSKEKREVHGDAHVGFAFILVLNVIVGLVAHRQRG